MPISNFQYQEMMARSKQFVDRSPVLPDPGASRESDLHDQIIKFCAEQPQPWICIHSRMDKRQHANLGMPDFVVVTHAGTVWFIECKRKGSKTSPAQNAMLAWLRKNRANAGVVFSLSEFKELVK